MAEPETAGRKVTGRMALGAVVLVVAGLVVGAGVTEAYHHYTKVSPPPAYASVLYGLDQPVGAVAADGSLFVANQKGDSVTVISLAGPSSTTLLTAGHFGFSQPTAMATSGGDVFVANGGSGTITEMTAASHNVVRTITGFIHPSALAVGSGSLFVLDQGTGGYSLVRVDLATGTTLARSAPGSAVPGATALLAASGHLYVTSRSTNSVVVFDPSSLARQQELSGSTYAFAKPTGLAVTGSDLWVSNQGHDSLTEIDTSTNTVVRVVHNKSLLPAPGVLASGSGYVFSLSPMGRYPMVSQVGDGDGHVNWMMCNFNDNYLFNDPSAAVVAGSDLWVVNTTGNSITEMDVTTGKLLATIS